MPVDLYNPPFYALGTKLPSVRRLGWLQNGEGQEEQAVVDDGRRQPVPGVGHRRRDAEDRLALPQDERRLRDVQTHNTGDGQQKQVMYDLCRAAIRLSFY